MYTYMHTVYLATIENGFIFLAFLVLLGFNVLFAIIAALLVFAVVNIMIIIIIITTSIYIVVIINRTNICMPVACGSWEWYTRDKVLPERG